MDFQELLLVSDSILADQFKLPPTSPSTLADFLNATVRDDEVEDVKDAEGFQNDTFERTMIGECESIR